MFNYHAEIESIFGLKIIKTVSATIIGELAPYILKNKLVTYNSNLIPCARGKSLP